MSDSTRLVQVQARNKYGRWLIYPVNDTAIQLAKLLNQDTLTPENIKNIKALGFKIEEIPQSVILDIFE